MPKSLQSEEVSYLFGVGEAVFSSSRNGLFFFSSICARGFFDLFTGLSLHKDVEQALDAGTIVSVPVIRRNETHWKCVITDKSILPAMLCTQTYYKVNPDLH